MIKVANYIAQYLAEHGIKDVFTIVGGGAMHLNDAFGHHKGLRCVYQHHEQACSFAAEAYARYTGNLPLLCVTSGPGGTNTLTGVMGAWVDSIPMLVISGQVKYTTTIKSTEVPLRQLGDQEFNITDCVPCMTKYAVFVKHPEEIRYHLERAIFLATHGRPGPVWLDIPLNVQAALIDPESLRAYDPAEDAQALPPKAKAEEIALFIEKVKTAKRPVILAGDGIRFGKAYEEFLEVIERLQIPVVTAWNAHDELWDEHPLYCGRPGSMGTRGGNFVVQNSDLLISFACRMNIRQISYNWEAFAAGAYKVYVDIDEGELRKPTLSIDLPIHADIKDVLRQILDTGYRDTQGLHSKWIAWCKQVNNKYPAVLPDYHKTKSPINPYVFMKKLSQHLPEGNATVTGNGSACVCSFQAMEIKKGQRLFTNSGCATMGYGLPGAIGVCVARNNQQVVSLEGDGSMQMNLQELQTVVHHRMNIKIFWLNNDGYHSMRQTQSNLFDGDFCGISGDNGVSFPDAEKIAAAYGLPFVRVDNLETIDEKIDEALQIPGPVLCEAILDKNQFFEPKLSSKVLPDGSIVSPPIEDMYPFLPKSELSENMIRLK